MPELETIVKTYGAGLARVAASYEADPHLQEDVLQEILLAIHSALPSLRDEASLGPFVFRIAHNRGVTHVIRQRTARRSALLHPSDESATPEQEVLAAERSNRLMAAVRRLALPYRQVITLALEELSYAEIAEALDISVSNVGVRVNRAKAQLRELLDAR
jgi:RNA polymerase sigma-70 factor (ECF subfamily)